MIRVLIAEDHQMVREGLRLMLEGQSDISVVGEVGDGRAAIDEARALRPNVVVLDLSMPGVGGLEAAKALHESLPSTSVVALTRHSDPAYVQQMQLAGAAGYVLKRSPTPALLEAIRAAASGNRYLDPALKASMTKPAPRGAAGAPLSGRETAVLRQTACGHSNKQIAASLGISVKTVEVHKSNAMRKLDLAGRADVVRYAVLQGWLQDP